MIEHEVPEDHGLTGILWTTKKIRAVVAVVFAVTCARSTLWTHLRRLKLSWQKTKKILGKADPVRRAQYMERFHGLFADMCRGRRTILYIDEAHLHQDMDLGYGWAPRGKPFWRLSESPGLHNRINWYGAYDFTHGRSFIWAYPTCNGANTADFLARVAAWARDHTPLTIIWDGAPVHRARTATAKARALGLDLQVLPSYSPDLNPIEGLWKWMREEVTQGRCHSSTGSLFDACKAFVSHANEDSAGMIDRLWPRLTLDAPTEKLRFSN